MRLHHLILWLALLVAPGVALVRLAGNIDVRILLGTVIALNLATHILYAADKRRAQRGEWRVAESMLHALELLGGWPAAYLAQRRLPHKISKRSFQLVFWLIILAHQYAAIDWLMQWRIAGIIQDGLRLLF